MAFYVINQLSRIWDICQSTSKGSTVRSQIDYRELHLDQCTKSICTKLNKPHSTPTRA